MPGESQGRQVKVPVVASLIVHVTSARRSQFSLLILLQMILPPHPTPPPLPHPGGAMFPMTMRSQVAVGRYAVPTMSPPPLGRKPTNTGRRRSRGKQGRKASGKGGSRASGKGGGGGGGMRKRSKKSKKSCIRNKSNYLFFLFGLT